MDGKKRDFFKKRPNSHFKKKGSNNNKILKRSSSSNHERSSSGDDAAETVYRILCPLNKIGGVIGKGGGRIKALREETDAKITVSDSVRGSDERVITIYSSGAKVSKKQDTDEEEPGEEDEVESMEPHCAAQEALLKVHDKIMEEELFGGMTFDDENDSAVTIRLLVPSNMVGCLIGKGGDIIQRLRSETGAGIRVLPSDHLPTCAISTDELVQISGKSDVAKKALYEVSTLLHKNPRKDEPPSRFPVPPHAGQGFIRASAPMPHMLPPGNPMLSHRHSDPFGMPPAPWMGEYGSPRARFVPSGYNGVAPDPVMKAAGEFSMKILCSSAKIGVVIGKGGYHVKQLQQETGASIQVEDPSEENGERVIRAFAVEDAGNPRSQTIDAILQLQNEASELSVEGTITTRLLVPSAKVGCIIGQGGQIINEMRKRTRADIRVISKEEKPKCATEEEELVQVSGNPGVARDALGEISSRLRARILRDAPPAPPPSFVSEGRLRALRPHAPPGVVGVGRTGGYESYKGGVPEYELHGYPVPQVDGGFLPSNYAMNVAGHEYDPHNYPDPRAAARYPPEVSSDLEARIANKLVGSMGGAGRSNFPNHGEISGRRLEHIPEYHPAGPDPALESRGSVPPALYNPFQTPSGPTTHTPQGPPYPNMVNQQESHHPMTTNAGHSPYLPEHTLYYPDSNNASAAAYQYQGQHGSSYQQ